MRFEPRIPRLAREFQTVGKLHLQIQKNNRESALLQDGGGLGAPGQD
jgi:hypothetical protein